MVAPPSVELPNVTYPTTVSGTVFPDAMTSTGAPSGMWNLFADFSSMTISPSDVGSWPWTTLSGFSGWSPTQAIPRLGAPPFTTALRL